MEKQCKVFENVPIICFKKEKSLKDILARAKVSLLKTEEGFCGPCNKSKHTSLNHHLQNTYIPSDHKI